MVESFSAPMDNDRPLFETFKLKANDSLLDENDLGQKPTESVHL